MNFPLSNRLEMPILQELNAVGGAEDVRFIYERLVAYFPNLEEAEIFNGKLNKWRLHVQRAGKELDEQGLIKREKGIWTLTKFGKDRAASDNVEFNLEKTEVLPNETSHRSIQKMLVETGEILGFHAQVEFEFYDVVWREKPTAARLSHVFEVQSKGNIDSAFAKLKRAYDAQRSKIFLVINSETDKNRSAKSLTREFHELENVLTVLSFEQVKLLHHHLTAIAPILPNFLRG